MQRRSILIPAKILQRSSRNFSSDSLAEISAKLAQNITLSSGSVDSRDKVLSPYGGRHSVSNITAAVFGSYGFTGRYLMNELGKCGSLVYAPYRGCELEVRHLKPMFDHGQLAQTPFSPRDYDSIRESMQDADFVINLIGKNYETKSPFVTRYVNGKPSRVMYSFEEVNIQIPSDLARFAKEAGAHTFIHVSSLSADKNAKSEWSRTKALGEEAVRKEFPNAIIIRPATLFGAEDRFLNRIGKIATSDGNVFSKLFPILNNGSTLLQPVYAPDVAKAIMAIIRNHEKYRGKTFQLAGPAEYTLKEVIEFVLDVSMRKKTLINIPSPEIFRAYGQFREMFPNPSWTQDFTERLLEDVVLKDDPSLLTFKDLKIEPQSMDKVAFDYLHRFRKGGHFRIVQGYYGSDL